MSKPITYEEYQKALKQLEIHQDMVDRLKFITRSFIYQEESERVKDRKIQSIIENNKNQGYGK